MNLHERERARRAEVIERASKIRAYQRGIARDILGKITAALADNPETTSIQTPLLKPDNRLPGILLRRNPELIANHIDCPRTVTLYLDESTEPPMLHIMLGGSNTIDS